MLIFWHRLNSIHAWAIPPNPIGLVCWIGLPDLKSAPADEITEFLSKATMAADEVLKDIITVNAAVNACEKVFQATFAYYEMNAIQWVWKSYCRDSDIFCGKN